VVRSLDHAGVPEFDVAGHNGLPTGRDLFDGNGVPLDAQSFGIDPGLAGLDVKLPAVPRAADDLTAPQIFVSTGGIGRDKSRHNPQAERPSLVRTIIEAYAHDLRGTLRKDVDRARAMLSSLLRVIILRPEKDGLWAEMRGNFHNLLNGTDNVASVGAGRGIWKIPLRQLRLV